MKLQLLGISLAAASASQAADAKCSAPVPNTDYWGNDLKTTRGRSAAKCCSDCGVQPGCTHYVWNSMTSTCILKGGMPNAASKVPGAFGATLTNASPVSTMAPVPMPGGSKCSTIERDTDYWGNDLGTTQRDNFADCCTDCQNKAGCTHYVWYYGTCILKGGVPNGRGTVPGAIASKMIVNHKPTSSPAPSTAEPKPTPSPTPSTMAPKPTPSPTPSTEARRPTTSPTPSTEAPRPTAYPTPSTAEPKPTPSPTPSTMAPKPTSSSTPSTEAPKPTPSPSPSTEAPKPTPSQTQSTAAPKPTPSPTPSTMTPTPTPSQGPSTEAPKPTPSPNPSTEAPRPTPSPTPSTAAPKPTPSPTPSTEAQKPTTSPTPSTMAPNPMPSLTPSTEAPRVTPSPTPSTAAPMPTPSPTLATMTPTPMPSPRPSTEAPKPTPSPTPSTMAPNPMPSPTPSTEAPKPTPSPKPSTIAPSPTPSPIPSTAAPKPTPSPTPSTKAPGPVCGERVRKSWRMLDDTQRSTFLKAVSRAMDLGYHKNFVDMHANGMTFGEAHGSTCSFLFWHRRFLLAYEQMLRSLAPEFQCLTLPYLDYVQDSVDFRAGKCSSVLTCSNACSDMYKFTNKNNPVDRANWSKVKYDDRFGFEAVKRLILPAGQFPGLLKITSAVERNVHNIFHSRLGGDMTTARSNNDPIFYMHHATIDLLHTVYRECRLKGVPDSDPRNFESCTVTSHGQSIKVDANSTPNMMRTDMLADKDPEMSKWFQGLPNTYGGLTNTLNLGEYSYKYQLTGLLADMNNQCDGVSTVKTDLRESAAIMVRTANDDTDNERMWRDAVVVQGKQDGLSDGAIEDEMEKIMIMMYENCFPGGTVVDFTDEFKATWGVTQPKRSWTLLHQMKDGTNPIKISKWTKINEAFYSCAGDKKMY